MRKQFGGATVVALISVVVLILAVFGICAASYVSAYNYGNTMDNQLIAIKQNNKNIYAEGTQKIMEIAQVPGMYRDDLKSVITADVQGKFGKDGSKATMQWFKDRNITIDSSMYTKIQETIIAFRDQFQINQTRMIDVVRSYRTSSGSLWTGMWLRIAGFPRVNLDDFKPITTDQTEAVFKAGKEAGPMKLR